MILDSKEKRLALRGANAGEMRLAFMRSSSVREGMKQLAGVVLNGDRYAATAKVEFLEDQGVPRVAVDRAWDFMRQTATKNGRNFINA